VKFGSLEGTNTASVLRYSTFEVGALNTDTAYAGQITAGALTKVGTGKLVLSGANTYTGATIISNGTLQVDGSLSTGAVTVYGTLAGQGTIGGASEVTSGGTLAPGDGIGTLTVNGNLTLDAGSTNLFEVNASTPTNDAVALGGSVTYGGVLKIVPGGTFSNGQTFTLFSGAGATNVGNFASIAGSPGAGLAFRFTNGVLSVASTVVISTNAYLTSLVVTPGTLTPTFTTNGYVYAFTNYLPNSSVTVTVTNADSTATNTLFFGGSNLGGLASGATSSALTLSQGVTNVVKVQVVAQDGVTTNNYTVNVTLQPNLSVPHLTNSVSGGTNLVFSWPADHLGYRLLVQTNNLNKGVSGNTNDWGTVAGSQSITATNIAIIKTGVTNEYYKLVYP
jgi:autotransporter-associated beta strand protein